VKTRGEIVVYDRPNPCPYLPGETARLPHRLPAEPLTPEEFDQRMEAGDRRSGPLLYRPACPRCSACEPIRLNLMQFAPRESQRRTKRRGDAWLEVRIRTPIVDARRIDLFNRHRAVRGLDHGDGPIDEEGYRQFLTETCCETVEFAYLHEGKLVGVAIADLGRKSLSAVYCFYEPEFPGLSLGTYSVLRQVEFCQQTSRTYLYLGFYIAQSPHMVYKGEFRPHERLVRGQWTPFG
jgi:arginyl-tRNA--protein-N-Asp/Glu arginylyltransferase